jgi:membrane-bound lytic murein transglycosylase F
MSIDPRKIHSIYDADFARAGARFLPRWDWRWLKAQCWQESQMDPKAVSPVGAGGLPQFMPDTWNEAKAAFGYPIDASVFEPSLAIPAQAWYMERMWNAWKSPRPDLDRRNLAFASYNAGLGHILDAQKLAGGAVGYDDIIAQLVHVTGEANSAQTRTYVTRINAIYAALSGAPNFGNVVGGSESTA